MAIDIGTGVINIEIDRRQVRQEALQASRVLAGTRTELRPQIDVQQLAARLRAGIQQGGGRETWRPFQLAGTQAMQAVGASGVAALSAIEARGLATAVRLRAAFASVRIPPQVAAAARAGPRVPTSAAIQGGVRAGGGIGAGVGVGAGSAALGGLIQGVDEVTGGLGSVAQALATAGPVVAAFAAATAGLTFGIRRFQRFGGFQGFNAATGGSLLEALGFQRAGREARERFDDEQARSVEDLTGATDDLARARARAAAETKKSSTAEQRARGATERQLREDISRRQREIANFERRQERARQSSFFSGFRVADLQSGIDLRRRFIERDEARLRAIEEGARRGQTATEVTRVQQLEQEIAESQRVIRNLQARRRRALQPGATFGEARAADLQAGIDVRKRRLAAERAELAEIRKDTDQRKRGRQTSTDRDRQLQREIADARERFRQARASRRQLGGPWRYVLGFYSGERGEQFYNVRQNELRQRDALRALQAEQSQRQQARGRGEQVDRPSRAERQLRDQLRILNEQQIESAATQADEAKRQADLLTNKTRGDRDFQETHRQQSDRYLRAVRAQAVEAKRAEIFQRRQAGAIRRQLVFGQTGLRPLERLGVAFEGLGSAISSWATGIAIAAAATYIFVRAINAAARRFEEVQAAQIAASSIAQRTLAAPGGAAVDIGQVQAGIQAGAAGGLSQLTVARTAIDAIRTGSEDIFLNTETVLRDLRVVAAATGVAFEDATTRFFRGIIKREQELLDELGIVARVEAANERYARSINVAASQLTPFQQQLAFANEVYRQLSVSANQFGQDAVLSTQRATEASNRLGAVWSDLFSDLGAQAQGLSVTLSAAGIGIAQYLRFALGIRRQRAPEVEQVSSLNRVEAERNRLIAERLGLISKQAIAGNLDVQQQRSLVEVQRQIAEQQRRFGEFGAGDRFNEQNTAQASANLLESQGILSNLREGRERSRIAALQGPLAALLSSLEGGGRIARLSAEAYQDLTRGTDESREAIELMAVVFERSVPEVEELIEKYRQLDVEQKKASSSASILSEILRNTTRALRFAPLIREEVDAFAQGLQASVLQFRDLGLGEFGSAPRRQGVPSQGVFFGGIPGELEPSRRVGALDQEFTREVARQQALAAAVREQRLQADTSLDSTQQFALAAADMGITLDVMHTNLSSFVEGITLEGQNLRQALTNFLQSIARTLIQSGIRQGFGDFGGYFTNAVQGGGGGGGSTYNTVNNIGIANPLQARAAESSARIFGGAGGP